jgi:hypothetical protein
MYVPATPAASALTITPAALESMAPPPIASRGATELRIGRERLDVLTGHAATITGSLTPALAGRVVDLQRLGWRGWRTIAATSTLAAGAFTLRYRAPEPGSARLRVVFGGDAEDLPSRRRAGVLNVFRLAGASWYGGGGSLACGGWLTSTTMGVANRTLPCGTLVTLRYDGRSVRVPVIDRGPYVAGREFDLTEATKRALGFAGTGEVWSTR